MSDDSDKTKKTEKRCKRPLNAASSTDSSDSGSPLAVTKRSRKQLAIETESEASPIKSSDNSSPLAPRLNRRRRVPAVQSDDETSSSEDEEIIAIRPAIRRGFLPVLSDYESGTSVAGEDAGSESEGHLSEGESGTGPATQKKLDEVASGSSSESDGQSERCPICLIKFVSQEVGTPETCDHFFCAPCIQEWSKNVNTCPVDRQPYKLILIREHLDGKVIRQVPVGEPSSDQEPQEEDSTCCEICSLSDREETLLLCDGCDNGYHMECLNPPLEYVPIEEWYCPECAPRHRRERTQERTHRHQRNEQEEEERDDDFVPLSRFRLVPRTRQAERVRRNVQRNGNGRQQVEAPEPTSSGVGSAGTRFRTSVRARASGRASHRTRRQSRRTGVRIKRIVTDDGIIEVILKCKKKGRKRRTRKKKRSRLTISSPRTAKGRLAARLGMCKPKMTKQVIPEAVNKQEITSTPINHQRHQAGIPTLDLFGRREQLDYFSESEPEEEVGSIEGGLGVLSRARVARPSDRLLNRKKAASILSSTSSRKPVKIEKLSSPAGPSLLDSILNSQTLWHSKKTEIKSNSDGSLKVIPKGESLNDKDNKVDVKKTSAPVKEAPMFPGGRANTGAFKENSTRGGANQGSGRNYGERSEESNYQSSAPSSSEISRPEGSTGTGPLPLRGVAPIRFRMNIPPKRPNIHSYPSDNIPPPPPLRLRSPTTEITFPANNSPEASPEREDEDVDIYSDIEQESNTAQDTEERTFGALEPPPEPPFLMTMEPPPEPPALLMNLNDDASDDEPSGLVIDDPPAADVYDPCAVNSDDSSTSDAPLPKPPGLPSSLKKPELVANYSSDSCPTQGSSSYNPELPTYSSTRIFGPLPRPASHHSSEGEDNDEECPNFSLYSATSMKLARRGLDLDIPIPPPIQKDDQEDSMDIPLPSDDIPPLDKESCEDIPVPPNQEPNLLSDSKSTDDERDSHKEEAKDDSDKESDGSDDHKEITLDNRDAEEMSGDEEDDARDEVKDSKDEDAEECISKIDENKVADDDKNDKSESDSANEDEEKVIKNKLIKNKDSEAGEDECSTQGDVLDLAIESEANLENNLPHDDSEEQNEITLAKSPIRIEESDEKIGDGGDKSDGLVDITDEEMSVYDAHDNIELEKLSEQIRESIQNEKQHAKSLDSGDDNSLVGGATSAVSAASLNDSDNVQTSTLPGLEGLETETISESEDVNFDELPSESHDRDAILTEDDLSSSRRKKKKKSRKMSQNEDISNKGINEPLEFEEGEIIEDKPKKEKKLKSKSETEIETDENAEAKKPKQPVIEKEKDNADKKPKKKKDKASGNKEKTEKSKEKEPKEKTLKPGEPDENISWKKLSKSTKERNYRDGKEKDDKDRERDRDRENKEESSKKKSREKRKELERYDVRRLISEKPKRPKKDEFGRDISPSSSSLSPYRPPRYRSPLRTRNRSRTRSRSFRSRSRSRGRRRRSRSRGRVRSRDRSKRSRTRDRSRKRSRSKNRISSRSRDRRRSLEKTDRVRLGQRSLSRSRRKSRSKSHHSHHSKKHRSSYSKSWSPSWSRSSMSRSHSPRRRRRSKSITRSRSRSWSRERVPSLRGVRTKEPPKNLTVIVPNKEALKKKEKKKTSKKKDDRRKKKRGQSPAPSKEVFTSGDNILVSVNFKNANKNPEIIPATTPLLRESSKRKRDDLVDGSSKKKKSNSSSKKTPGKKSNRLAKINEAAKNAKPVAIIDLDVSPFRAQTPSPKEVIVLSDSGDEGDKQHSEMQDDMSRMGHSGINQSMLSLSSIEHGQKNSVSQPESPVSSFMHNSSGPKTPPEPHIKFSISTKQSQMRMLSNPLMEPEEEMHDDNIENEVNEIMHKGPNTPPEPPPDMTTPVSPPTTPYDPFDPTKSRSPSPQPRSDAGSQLNTSREDKSESVQNADDEHPSSNEPRTLTPPNETEETKKTPEPPKVHSTPKNDSNTEISPKVSPPTGSTEPKLVEDTLMQPIKKLLADANKLNVTVHKSPEKLITVVISQQTKSQNQTPKQPVLPLKAITPNKQMTPKSNTKHQLFSTNLVKQVPILGTLLPGPLAYTPSSTLNNSKMSNRSQQNGDTFEDMDIDPSSPYSPGSSEGDDLFEPPVSSPQRSSSKPSSNKPKPSSGNKFDSLFGSSPAKNRHARYSSKPAKKSAKPKSKGSKKEEVKVKLDEDQLKILDDLPSSAVEMQFLKKLNRQERVVEEVKLVLKPHYAKKHVTKEEYKEILRRSVPKICHNKSGEINPIKIQHLVEAYVKKFRYAKKKAAGAIPPPTGQNKPKPQKTLWS